MINQPLLSFHPQQPGNTGDLHWSSDCWTSTFAGVDQSSSSSSRSLFGSLYQNQGVFVNRSVNPEWEQQQQQQMLLASHHNSFHVELPDAGERKFFSDSNLMMQQQHQEQLNSQSGAAARTDHQQFFGSDAAAAGGIQGISHQIQQAQILRAPYASLASQAPSNAGSVLSAISRGALEEQLRSFRDLRTLEQHRKRLCNLLDMDPRSLLSDEPVKQERNTLYTPIGLNLGVRTYFSAEDQYLSVQNFQRMGKRARASFPSAPVPLCQAEGCKADLNSAKHYHRRHKVCELHSKAATVTANGQTQRFCQQCSRFHPLGEFDEGKRSCRKRLADHNRRRRKPPQQVSPAAAARNETSDEAGSGGVTAAAVDEMKPPSTPTSSSQEHNSAEIESQRRFQNHGSESKSGGAHSTLFDRTLETQSDVIPPTRSALSSSSSSCSSTLQSLMEARSHLNEHQEQLMACSSAFINSWLKPVEQHQNSAFTKLV